MAGPTEVRNVLVRFGSDASGLITGALGGKEAVKELKKELREGVTDLAKYGAAAAVAGAAVAGAFIAKGLQAVDAQEKLANRLNTTSESLAVVRRAGELTGVSMDKITQASGDLTRRLSQAAEMGGPVAQALAKINLSASELQALPLDQRILKINESLNQFANAGSRAAIAGRLFGEEGSLAMTQIDASAIERANKEIDIFGLRLSKVDAIKVEMANDAMSSFGSAASGASQQLAVAFAPVLKAVSDLFVKAVDDAGGMGPAVARGVEIGVKVMGFLMDAVEGVRRTFEVAGKGIAAFALGMTVSVLGVADSVVNGPTLAINELIGLLSKLPGVEIEPVGLSGLGQVIKNELQVAKGALGEAIADIDSVLLRPMPSEAFKQFVKDAQAAGQAAAEAAAAAAGGNTGPEGNNGLNDATRKQLEERLELIRQSFLSEEEIAVEKYVKDQEALALAHETQLISELEHKAMLEALEREHEENIAGIRKNAADAQLKLDDAKRKALEQGQKNFFSSMVSLMNTESRALFNIGKVAAIGQAAVKGSGAVMDAWAAGMSVGGPWAPVIAAGYAAAAGLETANLINNIRSQTFGGAGAAPVAVGQGSSGVSTPATGGGGGGAGGGGNAGPSQELRVSGLDPRSLFSGDMVRGLAEELLDYQRNGGKVVFG